MWARSVWRHTVGDRLNLFKDTDRAYLWSTAHHGFFVRKCSSAQETIAKEWTKLSPGNQEPYTFTSDQEKFLTKGDESMCRKLKELQLQLYLHQQQGRVLPENVQLRDIQVLLHQNPDNFKKYLEIIIKRSYVEQREQQLRLDRKTELEQIRDERKVKLADLEYPWLEYTLFHNTVLPRVTKGTINTLYDSHAFKGLEFGQKIVIDCSYDAFMGTREIKTTANHIMSAYVSNRRSLRPFAIHFCNVNKNSRVMQQLRVLNPHFETDAAVHIHSSSYQDLFDRKNLVYISHDAKQTLQYNPNHIYILGGLVDRMLSRKLCLKKARKERVTCVSLPIRNYIQWKGPLFLSLNHYMDILLELKDCRDWCKALLKNLPQRKVEKVLKIH